PPRLAAARAKSPVPVGPEARPGEPEVSGRWGSRQAPVRTEPASLSRDPRSQETEARHPRRAPGRAPPRGLSRHAPGGLAAPDARGHAGVTEPRARRERGPPARARAQDGDRRPAGRPPAGPARAAPRGPLPRPAAQGPGRLRELGAALPPLRPRRRAAAAGAQAPRRRAHPRG